MNPLFPTAEDPSDDSYVLPHGTKRHISPDGDGTSGADSPAVALIRRKIQNLYAGEPNARQEAQLAAHDAVHRSTHQAYMHQLTTSGKSMAEIQAAWHRYYASLTDAQKHEVWQEFYAANAQRRSQQTIMAPPAHATTPQAEAMPQPVVVHHEPPSAHAQQHPTAKPGKTMDRRSVASIKKQVLARVRASDNARRKAKQHLQSLAVGLGLGALVLLVFLFGLFNELVITPFIKPSSASAETPIILSTDAPAPSSSPELIIPKINVQLPLLYGGQSLAEKDVQKALEDGVFHYPTTAVPGQKGNAAYFGHSSNNIFNKGKYKFAFVLLKDLAPGDIFYLTYDGKVYTYKVYRKQIVEPNDTWVLGPVADKTATATLITCDPPGTTRHRLVVWGEQISPDPNGNASTAAPSPALQSQQLPGKGPGPWSRFWNWINPF